MEPQDHATAGAGETIPIPIASTAMQESQTPAVPAKDPAVPPEVAYSSANEAVAQPEANKATTAALPQTPTDTEPVVNPSSADPVPQSISQSETAATPVAHHHPADLEVAGDSDDSFDSDSALGSSLASSTVSLRSSIYQYIEENGRTYHAYNSGKYMMPNDEDEQARLDLQHHLFRMTMDDKLCLAPLSNPQHVLDIGTGTGIWAIEFAQEYPSSMVIGTDLSPIQPAYVPPNCRFEIDDAEDDWVYSQKFDFIHGRALLSCFKNNRSVIKKIFDNLAPGGYFELQDPCMPMRSDDGTLTGTALDEWQTNIITGLKTIGTNLSDSSNWGKYMVDAGFVDVVETRYFWATNPWPRGKKQKLQAMWCCQNLLDGINAMTMAIYTRVLGWSKERIEVLLAQARNDLKDKTIHAYAEVYVVYGRKPE